MHKALITVHLEAPSVPDPQSIFRVAQSFYLAGTRCALDIEVGPNLSQSLVTAAVVNFCFSIELFCKALSWRRLSAERKWILWPGTRGASPRCTKPSVWVVSAGHFEAK